MTTFHYPWDGNEDIKMLDLPCTSDNGPDVTFWTPEGYSEIDDGPFPTLPLGMDFLCGPNNNDDWIDVYLEKITADNVRKTLAFINHCEPEDIDFSN